jgi:methionyl-tRNA synthetase
MSQRRLFVTTALPYANGNFHIGHIMEYIQADIWVRFQRMQGHAVNFVGADDAHGAPIMIAAEKAGKTPQQFVADIAAGRKPYLDGFHISFDNWHSTDGPENHQLAQQIYLDLAKAGLIATKTIEQFFDAGQEHVPARPLHQGRMPQVRHQGPVRRQLRKLRRGVCAHRPDQSVLGPVGRQAGAEEFGALLLQAVRPALRGLSEKWTQDGKLQPEVANKVKEWFWNADGTKSEGLGDWDISRDAPYFGIEIPDAPGKYFYVWLDAPVGYLASLKNLLEKRGANYDAYMADARPGAVPLHRQGHRHLPHAVLAGHAAFQRPQDARQRVRARLPHREQRREDEQEPRHRAGPARYLSLGMNPEWLRYYLAAKLNARNEDIDFNADDFMARVNSDLVGKYINIASRAAGFIAKRFAGKLGEVSADGDALLARCAPRRP